MGVYINGLEVPKNCWECHFGHGETGVCVVDFKNHGDWNEPHDCPLVPVPPHGRLIDADALLCGCERIQSEYCTREYAFSQSAIENAPTIIPAEEGET